MPKLLEEIDKQFCRVVATNVPQKLIEDFDKNFAQKNNLTRSQAIIKLMEAVSQDEDFCFTLQVRLKQNGK